MFPTGKLDDLRVEVLCYRLYVGLAKMVRMEPQVSALCGYNPETGAAASFFTSGSLSHVYLHQGSRP